MEGTLSAKLFQSDGFWIFYTPALEISAYGDTQQESEKHFFNIYLPEFFNQLIEKPSEGIKELERLGWKKSKFFRKRFTSNAFVDRNGFLQQFDLPEDTHVIDKSIEVGE